MHSTGLQPHLNLWAHYPPRPGWGADKCTLGPQAKLIHLPSFSRGSEVAAARRQGRGGLIWRERQTGGGGETGRRRKKESRKMLLALFSLHVSFHRSHTDTHALCSTSAHISLLKLLLRHALATTPSPKLEISPRTSW